MFDQDYSSFVLGSKREEQEERDEKIKEILIQCCNREISADDAEEMIQELL